MILVDTSVWVDYFRETDTDLRLALESNRVLIHPMVIGELACGNFRNRHDTFAWLDGLPCAPSATHAEARALIEHRQLMGRGIGFIDMHLLAATALTGGARLWTLDKRLDQVATELNIAHAQSRH